MSKLLVIFLSFISFHCNAALEAMWTGVAGIYLTDGKSSLYFDPVFNRPNPIELIFGLSYEIDEEFVKNELKRIKIEKVDGTFIGHSHSDHAIDMHLVQKYAGGKIYGSKTTGFLAQAHKVSQDNIVVFKHDDEFQIGDFNIKVLETKHGLILGFYEYQHGELTDPIKGKPTLSDYQMGGSFSFLITHPEGTILVQQSSRITKNEINAIKGKDLIAVFQGIANRRSSKELYDKLLSKAKSIKQIVPIHHDNFFFRRKRKKIDLLYGVKLDEFLDYSQKMHQPVYTPQYDIRFQL